MRNRTTWRRNPSGNIVYTSNDKEVAAKLAGNVIDEEWATEHVKRCLEEIRSTWSATETERRTCEKNQNVTVTQIVVHHVERGCFHRKMIE